ncbi:MAG TPA: NAD-dependent DNA ligase LigA [Patescibacteria group bacterium]
MIILSELNLAKISSEELGEMLINAKKAYYTGGKPIMDDHTYDTLEEVLRQKNPYHRFFTKVGAPNFDTGFDKKKHVMPMGSQNKVTSFPELEKYFRLKDIPADSEFIVQPKCDGLSLEIEYKNGLLVDAITRGDGTIGDVITQNVVKMKNFVNPLKLDFTGSVRCEIVVTNSDFKKLNDISEETYSNPRNAASGISQRLDSKFSEYCTLMAVDITAPDNNFPTEDAQVDYLKKLGITAVDSYKCRNVQEIEKIYQDFMAQKRLDYPFEIDGLVIKLNDQKIQQQLGFKNNRPKGQVAYKFPSRSDQTRLLAVVWQTGPFGTVTPVGQVEPVEISGAVINFASLANFDLVKEMDLNIGDIVEVSRRGDVIPHIEKVISKVNPGHISAPTECPVCGTRLIADAKYLRCPNTLGCPAQTLGSLRLFCATLDIKGISDKTIEKLVKAGKLALPGDFYKLTVKDFVDLEGLGEKSGGNIVREIQAKKKLSLVRTFDAAAIPNFSAARIEQVISAGFNTPEKILKLDVADLEALPGFQVTLATKIVTGIRQRLDSIRSILNEVTIINEHKSDKLANLNFAITGQLSAPRKTIEDLISQSGGKVVSAVTGNTSYLVSNETDSDSSKFVSAKKLNVPVITEAELMDMLGR